MHTYRRIYYGNLPRAYGLLKIHKPNCPVRIIVSSINSPLFSLFLKNILHESLEKTVGHVTNSRQLVEELSGFIIESDHAMASLDVTSLFTNVPTNLALESISRRWNLISQNPSIPEEEFKDAEKFVLDSTYFMFNNVIDKLMAHRWVPPYLPS